MKTPGFLCFRKKVLSKSIALLSFLFFSAHLNAQNPVNFSGTWSLDNAKSSEYYKDYKIICTIKQTPESFTIEETFLNKSGEKEGSSNFSYTLDEKVDSKEEYGGITRKFTKWSDDRKVLTTTFTTTVGENVYGSNSSFKLSDNGLVMTVTTTDVDPSKKDTLKQVLNKNQ